MSEAVNHGERAHALLSASASERWLSCSPSARLEEKYPETTSTYAEEGTLAHELSEIKLRSKYFQLIKRKSTTEETKLRREKVSEIKGNALYLPEMEGYTDEYVGYVIETYAALRKQDKSTALLIEYQFNLTEWVPEGFGTNDSIVISNGVLHIFDLKYGQGKLVYATLNSQLMLYGLGALSELSFMYDIHTVVLHIVQPRRDHTDTFTISAEDLLKWGTDEVKPKAELAFAGSGDPVPGTWCHFCKHRVHCQALFDQAQELALKDLEDVPNESPVDLLEIYRKADQVISYLEAVKAHIYQTALEGTKWDGLKLVEGKANRFIRDPEAVEKVLRENGYGTDEIFNLKLKGITDLEKGLLGKKNFDALLGQYVGKPVGKPTLVPVTDKREEISVNPLDDLDLADALEEML